MVYLFPPPRINGMTARQCLERLSREAYCVLKVDTNIFLVFNERVLATVYKDRAVLYLRLGVIGSSVLYESWDSHESNTVPGASFPHRCKRLGAQNVSYHKRNKTYSIEIRAFKRCVLVLLIMMPTLLSFLTISSFNVSLTSCSTSLRFST